VRFLRSALAAQGLVTARRDARGRWRDPIVHGADGFTDGIVLAERDVAELGVAGGARVIQCDADRA
jgi:hypothetical protein